MPDLGLVLAFLYVRRYIGDQSRSLQGGQLSLALGGTMWHGVGEYLTFAALFGVAVHAVSSRYALCTFLGAALCSIGNLVHEAWLVNWRVNIGWGPPMFVVGLLLALPACALSGLPWLAARRWRKHTA